MDERLHLFFTPHRAEAREYPRDRWRELAGGRRVVHRTDSSERRYAAGQVKLHRADKEQGQTCRHAARVRNGRVDSRVAGDRSAGRRDSRGQYNFSSRFENGEGSNPEELLAAAEAACFSMALSGALEKNGTPPTSIETKAQCTIEKVGDAFSITKMQLDVTGQGGEG